MAIKKTKNLASGVSGEYWKVTSVEIDTGDDKMKATITLFKDAAHAVSNHPLGPEKVYRFDITSQQTEDNVVELAYEKIKARAESQVTRDTFGNTISPRDFDSDLSNGEDV